MKNNSLYTQPLFDELYSNYYQTAVRVLAYACAHNGISDRQLHDMMDALAFGGTDSDFNRRMQDACFLLYKDPADKRLHTPIRNVPEMPLTILEKQWLSAVLRNPRVQLFLDEENEIEVDAAPLFYDEMFVYYDRYSDGDPFEDPLYREHFRTVRRALSEHRRLHVEYENAFGKVFSFNVIPYRLEYSEKDDKFRLITAGHRAKQMNLSRFRTCTLGNPVSEEEWTEPMFETETMILELTDMHNALERVMLHFSDLKKQTQLLENGRYRIELEYRKDDEAEILIRILSFGCVLRVTAPKRLVSRIEERLAMQAMRFLLED